MRAAAGSRSTVAGRLAAALLAACAALAAVSPVAEAAAPWHREYADAQAALLSGDALGAEAALRRALAARPEPGCRVRTYGVRYRDYLPYYYLGLALERQGRLDEAQAAWEESRRRGVVQGCPATRTEAADLVERLARSSVGEAPAPVGGRRLDLALLEEQAVAAGAEILASAELAAGRTALARVASGDARASGEAEASLTAALFRARAEQPLVALLRREALEEIEEARLTLARLGPRASDPRVATARQRLADAATLLDERPSAATALSARRAAAGARQDLDDVATATSAAEHERVVRARAQADLLLVLAAEQRAGLAEEALATPEAARADRDLAEARRLAASEDEVSLRRAASLAELSRGRLAELARRPAPPAPGASRAVLELLWSDSFNLPPVRVPSAPARPEATP